MDVDAKSEARFMFKLHYPQEGRRPWLENLDSIAADATGKESEPCRVYVVEIIETLHTKYTRFFNTSPYLLPLDFVERKMLTSSLG